MPVFDHGRVYVAGGGDLWWGKIGAWLQCIHADGRGDITRTGQAWSYPLQRKVMATPAVHDGLVYIGDGNGTVHCVDARTGQACWTHDAGGEIWASALVADGKVYVATRRGVVWTFATGRNAVVLGKTELGTPISSTPVAANNVLFIATMNRLYAVAAPLKPGA
jgi:outer membrane protein assembly factor BamB